MCKTFHDIPESIIISKSLRPQDVRFHNEAFIEQLSIFIKRPGFDKATKLTKDMLKTKVFIPFDKMIQTAPAPRVTKYSLHDLFMNSDFESLSPNYQIDLKEPHLEEKYRKKIVVIKKTEIKYMGELCTQIMIQDVTAFHMVDQEIKENLSLI